VLAYNLKRVLNLVNFGKLMAAVGVQVPQSA
jgi:sulfite exporter TauE/SafE